MMDRRRALMAAQVGGVYIKDGLVHWWDAIDNTRSGHSDSTAKWEDLIGSSNLDVSLGSSVEWSNKALVTTRARRAATLSSFETIQTATVELVAKPRGSDTMAGLVISPNAQHAVYVDCCRIAYYGDNTIGILSPINDSYLNTVSSLSEVRSVAALFNNNFSAKAGCYINGIQASQSSKSHSLRYQDSDNLCIGTESYSYWLSADIYAIRIYNRHLSADEIAANYAIDAARYGL